MTSRVAAFVAGRWSVPRDHLRVDVQPLPGGLESAVSLARISRLRGGDPIPSRLVIKRLPAGLEREAEVYELLWKHVDRPPAVRLLGRDASSVATYLFLEDARAICSWPWSQTAHAAAVCRELARLHDSEALPRDAFTWDFERDLARSAQATLELAADARDSSGRRCWPRVGDLRRVVSSLPRIRHHLLSGRTSVIHGDMHPGNVILRRGEPRPDPVLIDWARARIGSPLEDVASWLHSLGCWEPQARRRHDSLMQAYLAARRAPRGFHPEVRVDYWFASASNGMSGAIRYHLAVLANRDSSDASRYDSGRALTAWARVIRRTAALLSTSPDRYR